MSIAVFTLVILTVYLIALKIVSTIAYKRSATTTEDYFLANRGVGIIALVATIIASVFSTGTVISAPSEFFTKGGDYFWWLWFICLPMVMVVFALKFWQLGKAKGFITPGEMIGDFFKSKNVQLLTAVIGLLSLIPYSAAQLVAIGKTFEALTDGIINYEVGVTIVALAMGLYLYYGGSRAVIWTDMIQGLIFTVLLATSAGLVLYWAGGWSGMTAGLANSTTAKPYVGDVEIKYYELLILCLTFIFLPHVWQRFYMASSARVLVKNIAILPFVFLILFISAWIIGTSSLSIFPNGLADGDSVVGAVFRLHAPYFGAFVLVAAFAAGMSTVDSQLLSSSSIITRDIRPLLPNFLRKMQDYQFARLTTVLLLLVVYFWSLTLKTRNIFSLIILGCSLTGIFVPIVVGMFYWKRSTTGGAFLGLGLGTLAFFIKGFTPFADYLPTELDALTWGLIVSTLVFIIAGFIGDASRLDDKREEYKKILSITL